MSFRWNLQTLLNILQASNYLLQLSDFISVKNIFHSKSEFTKGSNSPIVRYYLESPLLLPLSKLVTVPLMNFKLFVVNP